MCLHKRGFLGLFFLCCTACAGNAVSEPQLTSAPASPNNIAAPIIQTPTDSAPVPPIVSPTNPYFGAVRCDTAHVALCDDFEDGALGGAPNAALWSLDVVNTQSYVRIDNARAARGTYSVHVHTPDQGFERAMLVNTSILPTAGNTLYGRAFFYYQPPASGLLPQPHWTMIAASGTLPGQGTPTYARYGGQFTHLMANYYGQDQYAHAADNVNGQWVNETKMPANRWACLEWEYKGASNEMHLWLDEQEVSKVAIMAGQTTQVQCSGCSNAPWAMPTFDHMALGWETYAQDAALTSTGYDMWIDAVALDTQRIGCSR